MNKKLYVGNMPYTVSSDDLRKQFTDAGTVVDAVVISFKDTGRSKGFGFVEMETEEMAKKAIDLFNGSDMGGRKLIVSEARSQEDTVPAAAPPAPVVSAPVNEEPKEEKVEEPKAKKETKKEPKEEKVPAEE